MKIAAAQITPTVGDIEKNIQIHKKWIEIAATRHVDFIVFPELSITGYSARRASDMASHASDSQFNEIQEFANAYNITVAIGLPLKSEQGTQIGLGVYQPSSTPESYAKQILDPDEIPYFTRGKEEKIFDVHGVKLAPAICYESLQPVHARKAHAAGGEVYVVSSAKSESGIQQAYVRFPEVAKQYGIPVVFSNSVGPGDGFHSVGQSAIWNAQGNIVAQLNNTEQGLITFEY